MNHETGASADAQYRRRLVGVGVGPGDPELLTLKAARIIATADVVFAPVRRAGERSMALEIVHSHLDEKRQRIIVVPFPRGRLGETWTTAARVIDENLSPGQQGVFLTEGDPLLFGSFADVMRALWEVGADVVLETVPGVSSVTAAAAAAGIPLTDHQQRLAVIPATAGLDAIERALRDHECVVLLKVGRGLADILRLLDRLRRLSDAVYVRRCGWPDQQIVHDVRTLLDCPPSDYFAVLIVRQNAAQEE
ncbi:MAG: precorrin-2 C(20)-methyltransferase [Chloroflexota bacterium]